MQSTKDDQITKDVFDTNEVLSVHTIDAFLNASSDNENDQYCQRYGYMNQLIQMKELRNALIDLYLSVKIRPNEEIDHYNPE